MYCDLGLEFAPQYADLWANKGLIAMYAGNKKQAKEHFITAIRFNQEHAGSYMNLGRLYLDEGSYGKAHDMFQRALKVNPDYTEARYNLALTFINMKKLDKAEKELLTLLAVDPNIAQAHHDLGVVVPQGDKEEAAGKMAKAVQLAPNMNPEWWNDLGAVEMELARYNEAVQSFGSCVALKPEHAVCINNLSIAKRKAALTSSALKQFRDTQRAENSRGGPLRPGAQVQGRGAAVGRGAHLQGLPQAGRQVRALPLRPLRDLLEQPEARARRGCVQELPQVRLGGGVPHGVGDVREVPQRAVVLASARNLESPRHRDERQANGQAEQ